MADQNQLLMKKRKRSKLNYSVQQGRSNLRNMALHRQREDELQQQLQLLMKPRITYKKRIKRDTNTASKKNMIHVPSLATHLNRDCLLHLFTFLDIRALYTAANVSKKFRELAEDEFNRRFRGNFDFALSTIETNSHTFYYGEAKCFLYKFGNLIKTLSLHLGFPDSIRTLGPNFLFDIQKTCTLTELILNCRVQTHHIKKLQQLFLTIQKLKLIKRNFDNSSSVYFPELKILILEDIKDAYIPANSPKLEELYLNEVCDIALDAAQLIISYGPQLRVLSMKTTYGSHAYRRNQLNIIRSLGDRIERIEILDRMPRREQQKFQDALHILSTKKSLKIVKINFSGFSVSEFLTNIIENDIKIEHLHLMYGILSYEAAKCFARMDKLLFLDLTEIETADDSPMRLSAMLKGNLPPNLKELNIAAKKQPFNNIWHLKVLLERLSNLTHLRIASSDLTISLTTYNVLLEIVKKRPQTINLKFIIYRDNDLQLELPDELRDANKYLLDIEAKRFGENDIFPENVFYYDTESETSDDDDIY